MNFFDQTLEFKPAADLKNDKNQPSQSDSEEKSHPSRDPDDNFDEIMATFDKVKNQKNSQRDLRMSCVPKLNFVKQV